MTYKRIAILTILLLVIFGVLPALATTTEQLYAVGSDGFTGTVQEIDTSSNTVITTVTSSTSPFYIASNPAGTEIYIGDYAGERIQIIQPVTNAVIGNINLGDNPQGLATNSLGTELYVALVESNSVAVIDLRTRTVKATIAVSGSSTLGSLDISPDNQKIYVADIDTDRIYILNAQTHSVITSLGVAADPWQLCVSPSNDKVFAISNYGGTLVNNTMTVIDVATNAILANVSVMKFSYGLTVDRQGNFVYITGGLDNILNKYMTNGYALVATTYMSTGSDVYDYPTKADVGANGNIYVAHGSNFTVVSSSGSIVGTIYTSSGFNIQSMTFITPDSGSIGTINNQIVSYTFHSGFNTFYQNVNVSNFNTAGQLLNSNITDISGTTSFVQNSGSSYIISYNYLTTSSSFNIQPTESHYYIDISTGSVIPASQAGNLINYNTHDVAITITNWYVFPVTKANVVLNIGNNNTTSGVTDDYGRVTLWAYNTGLYRIYIYNTTSGLYKVVNRTLSGTTANIDVTGSFGTPSTNPYTGNQTNTTPAGTTGDPDGDIDTIAYGNVTARTITVEYSDISLSTTNIDISLWTQNQSNLSAPLINLDTYNTNNYGTVYIYNIGADPTGLSYLININGTYTNKAGTISYVNRTLSISFPGPLRVIPGLPLKWYKYLAWAALIVIGLVAGKFGVEEACIAISAVATGEWAIRWWYEVPDNTMILILGIAWTISIGLVFLKREREGRL